MNHTFTAVALSLAVFLSLDDRAEAQFPNVQIQLGGYGSGFNNGVYPGNRYGGGIYSGLGYGNSPYNRSGYGSSFYSRSIYGNGVYSRPGYGGLYNRSSYGMGYPYGYGRSSSLNQVYRGRVGGSSFGYRGYPNTTYSRRSTWAPSVYSSRNSARRFR